MTNDLERMASYVEKHRKLILDTERFIWKHPEIGYKEWQTTQYLVEQFEALGYKVTKPKDITGFIADLDTGKPGPKFAILGELDSLMCETHPEADRETKAVHACGHHCQTTALLGCAAALSEPGALEGMCGSIRFIAVPAEETIDMEFRADLMKKGIIHYNAGKIEYLYRGYFDDVDIAAMVHVMVDDHHLFHLFKGGNGCINKHFEFQGVAAHAGVGPWDGVNALYEANIAMTACNALRETFIDTETMRFHPILTQAGLAANAIPDVAKMDAYTRAASFEQMKSLNEKINRALAASAAALGGNVLIEDKPGNMPLHCDRSLYAECEDIIARLFGEHEIEHLEWSYGSTDMGDISSLIPAIHPEAAGAVGKPHGQDYCISDPEKACINPAKLLACLAYRLLSEDAAVAKRVIRDYRPVFASRAEYFKAINDIELSAQAVDYLENGDVVLHYKKNQEE
ncbi:amidohydrolase [Enterocloster citroniae]